MNITLKGCTKDNCYSTTNVSISNSSYNNIISLVVQFPSNKTLNTNATLYYQNGVTVQSNTITISTHDLQKFTLINITSNSVCLQFQYINGSTPNSDVILFTDNMNYTESYLISPDNQFTFIQCIDDIPAGNNLRLYACELATIKNCESNPLAVITDINITDDFTSLVLMSSVHSSSVSLTSTVLTTPSKMSVPLTISTSPVATNSTVPTTSSMTSLPTMVPPVPTPSIMSEFVTFPLSVLTTSTTSRVQLTTSSSIISSTTDTPTISSSTSIPTTRLTSTLVT
ncbi:PREDICTED: cell wall protein DAN4-like, partial [Amphimedon queenslandica]